jgi:hypothetical protein
MKVFLSSLEDGPIVGSYLVKNGIHMKYNLMSFFYLKGKAIHEGIIIRDNTDEILIDSGAHSFQKGKKVEWESYTRRYADFIKSFDRPNVLGYFEMDVDNVIGYEKVLYLRKILESVSDKIIPVWHKNRGIDDFKKMCSDYSGKIIAITGFKNEDIRDEQYLMFLKYAHRHGCKVHCLGMTRKAVLDAVPFDYVDSSSWRQDSRLGKDDTTGKHMARGSDYTQLGALNYLLYMKKQKYYENKWRNVNRE